MKENKPEPKLASHPFGASMTLLLIIFTVLLGLNDANAEEKTIRLGAPPTGWPPYIIVNQDRISGVAIDIVGHIASHLGYELKIIQYPEKRAHLKIEEGELDAWPDAKEWSTNPERYLWSVPMVESEDRLLFRKESPLVFDQTEDLLGKTSVHTWATTILHLNDILRVARLFGLTPIASSPC